MAEAGLKMKLDVPMLISALEKKQADMNTEMHSRFEKLEKVTDNLVQRFAEQDCQMDRHRTSLNRVKTRLFHMEGTVLGGNATPEDSISPDMGNSRENSLSSGAGLEESLAETSPEHLESSLDAHAFVAEYLSPRLELYSGESDISFSQWVMRFEDLVDSAIPALNNEQKLAKLKANLTGAARQRFEEFATGDKDTYEHAKGKLKEIYESAVTRSVARRKLAACKQHEGEKVSSFAHRLSHLVRSALCGQPESVIADRLYDEFLERLIPQLGACVKLGDPRDFEHARVKAEQYEDFANSKQAFPLFQPMATNDFQKPLAAAANLWHPAEAHRTNPTYNGGMNPVLNAPNACVANSVPTQRDPRPRCDICKSLSHLAYYCPQRLPPQDIPQGPIGNGGPCYNCGKFGHIARNYRQNGNFYNQNGTVQCQNCGKLGHVASVCRQGGYGQHVQYQMGRNNVFGQGTRHPYPNHQDNGQRYGAQANFASYAGEVPNFGALSESADTLETDKQVKALGVQLSELQLVNHQLKNQNQKLVQAGYPNTASSFFAEYRKPRAEKEKPKQTHVSRSLFSIAGLIMLCSLLSLLFVSVTCARNRGPIPDAPLICQTHASRAFYTLPRSVPCDYEFPKEPVAPAKLDLTIYAPNMQSYLDVAMVCKIVTVRVRYYVNFVADRIVEQTQEHHQVPIEECKKMVETKQCQYGKLEPLKGQFRTRNALHIDYPWPVIGSFAWRYQVISNCFVFDTVVSAHYGDDQLHTPLAHAVDCRYSNGACNLKDGSAIYWTPRESQRCRFTPVKSYSGTFMNFAWISDSQEIALSFQFPYQKVVDCKEEYIISQQGYAVIYKQLIPLMKVPKLIDRLKREVTEPEASYRNVTVRYVPRIIQSGPVTSEQLAAELTAVSLDVGRSVSFTFRHNFKAICSQINSVARQLHFAVAAQPVLASRHLLNVSDIHARYALTEYWKFGLALRSPNIPTSFEPFKPTIALNSSR